MLRSARLLMVALTLSVLASSVAAQNNITEFSSYWKHRTNLFRTLPNMKGEIIFLGDSITDGCEWAELTGNPKCVNRGIGSDTAWGVMNRIDEVTAGKPDKVFLMIGTNDLSRNKTYPEVAAKIGEIIDVIKKDSPATKIYLESVLPVIDGSIPKYENKNIDPLNAELVRLAARKKAVFVNLAPLFKDGTGQMKKEFTEDGLHINGKGYAVWGAELKK